MPALEDAVADLVGQVADVFDWEDFEDADVDIDILESDDIPYPYCDIVREDTDEVFRMFVTLQPLDLNTALPDHFVLFQSLESEYADVASEPVLVWRAAEEEEFWYMHRTEDGEIGLFHSDLSLDEESEEDDDEDTKDSAPENV